jgi:catalase
VSVKEVLAGNAVSLTCAFLHGQVFFIRDGASFPDLAHALKTNPVNQLSDAWRTADFLSFHPESMNMVSP